MKNLDLSPLKGLALPIIAPGKVPLDLAVKSVTAQPDSPQGDAYEIEWGSDNAHLKLRATSTLEKRQPSGAEPIEFDHRFFGLCVLERSGEELISDWFSEMQDGYPAYSVTAKGLETDDVIEFVRSLDYVRVN